MRFKTLDVGCGLYSKGQVNIDIKKANLKQKSVSNFVVADAQNLPFRDNCFSVIYSSHVMEHLPNPLQALREWKRVAGSVEIYTPSAFDLYHEKGHIYTWNLHTFQNILSIVFKNVIVEYTSASIMLHGRLGKYLPILNLMLAKLGFKREMHAICSE